MERDTAQYLPPVNTRVHARHSANEASFVGVLAAEDTVNSEMPGLESNILAQIQPGQ